jgi:hypothetical protein
MFPLAESNAIAKGSSSDPVELVIVATTEKVEVEIAVTWSERNHVA